MPGQFPLTPGQRGEAIRDLQRRLGAAGFAPAGAQAGVFCAATEASLHAFQTGRGLHPTGICDEPTWNAIVEASWKLGDRLLLLVGPNLRGDDVGELQAALARLGFDCGRVDGIFGPATLHALEDFQRNCGLTVDGVCGPYTVRALRLVARQSGDGPGVSTLRELATVTASSRVLADLRIVVGQFGGLSGLSRRLVVALRNHGAAVAASDEPDAAAQAAAANRYAAHVYVGFESATRPDSVLTYYAVPQFESAGGRMLASEIADRWQAELPHLPCSLAGMRLPILRETRMPAVLITLGSVQAALASAAGIASAVTAGLQGWGRQPSPG